MIRIANLIREVLKDTLSQIQWLPRYFVLFKRINSLTDAVILDAGCGDGIVTARLKKNGLKIIGIDRSFLGIRGAHSKSIQDIFVTGDVNYLPFRDSSFDLIFSLDVLNCVNDMKNAFIEFRRILKPRGRLIITITQDYTCSAKLFVLQRALRKIIPVFLYTYELPQSRGWLNFTDIDMAKKLSHVKTYSLTELFEKSKGLFRVSYYEYFINCCSALAYDISYGIKGFGFYLLRFLIFFVSVRIDHYFFRKTKGYALLVEFIKTDDNLEYIS